MQVKGRSNQIWINLATLLLQLSPFFTKPTASAQFSGLLSSTVKLKASRAICVYRNYMPRNFICEDLRQAVAKKVFCKGRIVTRTKNVLLTEPSSYAYSVTGAVGVLQTFPLSTIAPCSLLTEIFAAELNRFHCGRCKWAPGSRGLIQRQQQGN